MHFPKMTGLLISARVYSSEKIEIAAADALPFSSCFFIPEKFEVK